MIDKTVAVSLKSNLANRVQQLVVNIDYSNASLVEFLSLNGADIVFIDCEQGDTNIETIPNLVRAGHLAATPVIARLFSSDAWVIERYMLRGIDGIVIPRLDTAEQVREVVGTVKYCFPNDYKTKSIVVQIETKLAAQNLSKILEVEGIDAYFIGPVDLAKSLGYGMDTSNPAFIAELDTLIHQITAAKRSVGMLVASDNIQSNISKGVNFLYLHCNDFLREGSKHFMSRRP